MPTIAVVHLENMYHDFELYVLGVYDRMANPMASRRMTFTKLCVSLGKHLGGKQPLP